LAKAVKDYYLQMLGEVSPREDYYLKGGTATGRWVGSGAAYLDLHGTVSAEGLVRLFDGEHPGTGERLGRRMRRDGVAAWDVTFSADKSVSLLWALGDERVRKEVVEGFEEATAQALAYLESVASDTRGATKTVGADEEGRKCRVVSWPIPTTGYVAAAFTEFTSRANDPQLHSHVVIANKVQGVDGVWRTLDGGLLYRHQLDAGYLHEAVLRRELTERLGVRWQPVEKGMADIEGFTRAQIEAFSRRRGQLEAWREEQGLADTPAARQVAVIATRPSKHDRALDELEAEWRRRGVEVGLTPARIAQMLVRSRAINVPDPVRLFDRLASAGGVTAETATFGRSDVIREIAAVLPDGGSRAEIEGLADRFLESEQVLALPDGHGSRIRPADVGVAPGVAATGGERFTTVELLAAERRVLDRGLNGEPVAWRVPVRLVEAVLRRRSELTVEQRVMVRRFATSGVGVDVGVGPAGSGKTMVMAVLADLAELTGTPILGTSLAARAAVGLEEATGIPSTSLAALQHRAEKEGGLPRRVVVVVDEASMVGTRRLAALSDLVDHVGGKLILIGDPHQLPEIEAGGLFRTLVGQLPAVELGENMRQEQPWERAALAELRNGSLSDAMGSFREQRRVVVGSNREDVLARAVDDWYQHVSDTGDMTGALLLGEDNETVARFNAMARDRLADSGHLEGPGLEADGREYQMEDRVICLQNNRQLGVLNGDLGTVVEVDVEKRVVSVRFDRDGGIRHAPGWYLDMGFVGHGYALTGHKAQGITVDRTFTVVGDRASREWVYVAMSRGRQANTVYLTPHECEQGWCSHVPSQDQAEARRWARSSAKTAAVDQTLNRRGGRGLGLDMGLS
jgi:conjugative relaxase-like TrwC/TraI family protein